MICSKFIVRRVVFVRRQGMPCLYVVLLPLNCARRLVCHVIPQGTCTFGNESAPESFQKLLVNLRKVGGHGLRTVDRAHYDARLLLNGQRNQYDRHLPDGFVEVVLLQELRTDVVEFAQNVEMILGCILFHQFRHFVGYAADLPDDTVDDLEAVYQLSTELFALFPCEVGCRQKEWLRVGPSVSLSAHALDRENFSLDFVILEVFFKPWNVCV